jgi:FtsZ-binding cell division protein ZapB
MDNLSNLLTWLDNYQPPASPGQYYSYSNLGWSLIGMAACSISSEYGGKTQERELNCATIGVANSADISGRATAEETNHGLRIGKGRSFWRIASLTILRSLIAAGFVVALAPLPAQADEEERGRDKKFEALEAKVESLQATVSALESQIDTLQAGNTTLQNEIKSLKTSSATLQSQLAAVQSNHALLLGPFVNVDPNPEIGVVGPSIIFSGAIFILSAARAGPTIMAIALGFAIWLSAMTKTPVWSSRPLSNLAIVAGRTTSSSEAGIGFGFHLVQSGDFIGLATRFLARGKETAKAPDSKKAGTISATLRETAVHTKRLI